jgi:hypothetical protein
MATYVRSLILSPADVQPSFDVRHGHMNPMCSIFLNELLDIIAITTPLLLLETCFAASAIRRARPAVRTSQGLPPFSPYECLRSCPDVESSSLLNVIPTTIIAFWCRNIEGPTLDCFLAPDLIS